MNAEISCNHDILNTREADAHLLASLAAQFSDLSPATRSRSVHFALLAGVAGMGLLAGVNSARAETYFWIGSPSAAWNISTNWSPTGVPSIDDDVIIGQSRALVVGVQAAGQIELITGGLTINSTGQLTFQYVDLILQGGNAGSMTNYGVVKGTVRKNEGTVENFGTWDGDVQGNSNTLRNHGSWNGAVHHNSEGIFNEYKAGGLDRPQWVGDIRVNDNTVSQKTSDWQGDVRRNNNYIESDLNSTWTGDIWENYGSIVNAGASTWTGDIFSNSGTVDNSDLEDTWNGNVQSNSSNIWNGGTWNGDVWGNTGLIINWYSESTWNGDVLANTGTITNVGNWYGSLINSGLIYNNLDGVWTGDVISNDGTINSDDGAIWNGDVRGNSNFINNLFGSQWNGDIIGNAHDVANTGAWTGDIHNNDGQITNKNGGAWTGNILGNNNDIVNLAGSVWDGDVIANGGGSDGLAQLVNRGLWTGDVKGNSGNLLNDVGTWNGDVWANSGSIDNNLGGAWTGDIISNDGTITSNDGAIWNGDVLGNNSIINNVAGSQWKGDIVSNGGGSNTFVPIFNRGLWTGDVRSNSGFIFNDFGTWDGDIFANNFGIDNTGTWTGDIHNNEGQITNESGGAWIGDILGNNNAIFNVAGGVWKGDVVANDGSTNSLTQIVNEGDWTGNVQTNARAIYNEDSGTWNGDVLTNAGTIVTSGVWNGSFDSAGRVIAEGEINGAFINSGLLSVTGSLTGITTLTNTGIISMKGRGFEGQTFTMDSLVLSADSVVDLTLGTPSAQGIFDVLGDLTLGGALNITDMGGFGVGLYRIFDYGGTLYDQGLAFGSLPSGLTGDDLLIQTAVPGQVNVINTLGVDLLFWDGGNVTLWNNDQIDGGDGVWSAATHGWTDVQGQFNAPMDPVPGFAIFQTGAGTVSVDDSDGAIEVTGMQFAVDGYAIGGDPIKLAGTGGESIVRVGDGTVGGADFVATIASELTGTTTLVKTDVGTLVLTATNSHSGGTTFRGGRLEVASDASLGAALGKLSLDGGTLRHAAGFTSGRSVTLGQSHGTFDTNGFDAALLGPVGGPGLLIKTGDGELMLSGINSYGGTVVMGGSLVGNAAAISGDIANSATVTFDQASDASFAGVIGSHNGIKGQMVKTGTGILRLTGSSQLDWSIQDGGIVSSTDRYIGGVEIDAGAFMNFDQAHDGKFAGSIAGSGELMFTGGGTTELTGNASGFAGLTDITDSTLIVGGQLGGSVNLGAGGTLGGTGIVGATTVASGGIIAPGNSIGTLTVDGNLTFKPGSVYQVEVDPTGTSSDLIVVNGVARLAGSVMHIGRDGDYNLQSEYTILAASGGFAGTTFDGVSSKYTFLSALLTYSSIDVSLRLERNQVAFASVATTPNQTATAGGVDSLGAGNLLYDAVVKLDGPGAQGAFDQLSGEAHASGLSALIGSSGSVRSIVSQRFQSSFGNRGTASVDPLTSYASYGNQAIDVDRAAGFAAWGKAFGSWGRTSGDRDVAGVRRDDVGLLVGVDAILAETWSVGAFAGYSRSTFSVRDRNSSGSSDNFHLGFHGGTEIGSLLLNVGAAHSWHDVDTSRTVAFPGFADQLSASYRARTAQIFGEAGYRFGTGALGFEPFAGLAYVHTTTNGFTEMGGAAALTAARGTSATTFSTLGLRAFSQFEVAGMQATLRGMVAWRHAFGDKTPTTRFSFAGGNAFSVSGAPIASNTALVEAGVDLAIRENVTLGLSYDGQYSWGSQDHGFNARLRVAF